MIQVNFANILTIAIAGALGYALVAGAPAVLALIRSQGAAKAGA
jgi:hypothetical protein